MRTDERERGEEEGCGRVNGEEKLKNGSSDGIVKYRRQGN